MKILYKKNNISIPVKPVSSFGKILGLTFKSKNTDNLLFEFNKKTKMSIHSFFVFFPFLAIWLDNKNKVLESKIIKPFSLAIRGKNRFQNLWKYHSIIKTKKS